MMKKLTAFILALLMCLSVASAWSCPNCGGSMESNFCTECGTKKPANICPGCGTDFGEKSYAFCTECGTRMQQSTAPATPAIPTAAPTAEPTAVPIEAERAVITSIEANDNGTVTVSWTGGAAPYKVQYTIKRSDDFLADREAARNDGAYWNGATDVQDTSVTLNRIIPGVTYWIAVLDANDKGQRWEYTTETSAFTAFPVTMDISPRQRIGETPADIACIPVDTAGAADDVQHGLFIQLTHDNPGEEQELFMQLALTFPDGFKYLYGTGNISFASGEGRWRKWEFYSIDAMFTHLRDYQDVLTTGDLVVDVYLNGQLACSGTVPMGK